MNRLEARMRSGTVMVLLGAALPASSAIAQSALKEQVVGTWTYVSVDLVRPDGTRDPLFGPNPQGRASFDAGGTAEVVLKRAK